MGNSASIPVHHSGNNYPLRGNKGTVYEGGTRAISFVHHAGFPQKGQIRNDLFHIVDWFATIATIGGKKTPLYGDGMNQWDMITGKSPGKRTTIVYKAYKSSIAIRYKNYKLIIGSGGMPDGWIKPDQTELYSLNPPVEQQFLREERQPGKIKIRLFDLNADPTEHFNIADDHPNIVRKLRRLAKELRRGYVKSLHVHYDRRGDPKNFNGTYATGWCPANLD